MHFIRSAVFLRYTENINLGVLFYHANYLARDISVTFVLHTCKNVILFSKFYYNFFKTSLERDTRMSKSDKIKKENKK